MAVAEAARPGTRPTLLAILMIVAGLAMLGAMGGVGAAYPREFLRGYLLGVYFWLGFPLGCAMIRMTQALTGGRWGPPIRPWVIAAISTLPLMFLMWAPILGFMGELYPWYTNPPDPHNPLEWWRAVYLQRWFFVTRYFLYWVIWLAIGWALVRREWVYRISAAGLVLYWLAMTFAFVDWVQTLETEWYSTIFGAYQLIGQVLQAMALVALIQGWIAWKTPSYRPPYPEFLRAIGSLLLMMVILWAYMAFAQYLVTWLGNLPEEVVWYTRRTHGGWGWAAVFVGLMQLWFPFFSLLLRSVKEHGRRLALVAATILAVRGLELAWTVLPAFSIQSGSTPATLGMAGGALVAVGLVWTGAFVLLWSRLDRIQGGGGEPA